MNARILIGIFNLSLHVWMGLLILLFLIICISTICCLLNYVVDNQCFSCLNFIIHASFSQENVKTKHPQLMYESKLYKILQGGSNAFTTIHVSFQYFAWSITYLSELTTVYNFGSWNSKCEMVWH